MKSLWSFLGQRYPRKVKSIFLEHFYFCFAVLLIMVVSDDSWQRRRNARSWTRDIWRPRRLCWARQAALWPCVWNPFYAYHIALYCLHRKHGTVMTTWGGLPPLLPRWYLHFVWSYLLMRVMLVGVDRMLKQLLRKKGREYAWWWRQSIFKRLFKNPIGCHLCPGGDDELGSHLMTKWCTEASLCCFQNGLV